jgi:hypothetical protein
MFTKLTTLAIVAQAAVTPGLRLAGTALAPTDYIRAPTSDTSAVTNIWDYGAGGYTCLRNGFTYAWPQVFTAASPAVVSTSVSTTIAAFYNTATTQYGTINTDDAGTNILNSGCFRTSSTTGITATAAHSATVWYANGEVATKIPDRLFSYSANTYLADTVMTAAYASVLLNVDFVLAATFQNSVASSSATRADANYCDYMIRPVATLGATSVASTTKNFGDKATKCTYIMQTVAGKGAPAFSISDLQWWKFQLHYAEWGSNDMTGQSYLQASNKYTGTMTASTYPSPIGVVYPAGAAAAADLKLIWPFIAGSGASAVRPGSMTNWTPESAVPGGWQYDWTQSFSNQQGMFMYENPQTQTLSPTQMLDWMNFGNQTMVNYANAVSSFNTDKSAYNTALASEKTRAADFFKSIFEAPVTIPTRPSQPFTPPSFTGPGELIYFATTAEKTAWDSAAKGTKVGEYTYEGTLQVAPAMPSFGAGWLSATPDNTITTPNASWAGHVFGVMGQGDAAMPTAANAWANTIDATRDAAIYGMMVSLLPYDMTTAVMGGTKKIDITFTTVAWRNWGSIYAPTTRTPATTSAPDTGAKALAAGTLAVAAIAMTLA